MVAVRDSHEYVPLASGLGAFSLDSREVVIAKGNKLATASAGWEKAAGQVRELNFRRRTDVVGQLVQYQNAYHPIATEPINIETYGEIPEYCGSVPGESKVRRLPYVPSESLK